MQLQSCNKRVGRVLGYVFVFDTNSGMPSFSLLALSYKYARYKLCLGEERRKKNGRGEEAGEAREKSLRLNCFCRFFHTRNLEHNEGSFLDHHRPTTYTRPNN